MAADRMRDNALVVVPIDTARAFLRPSQLEDLVRAVASAGEYDEHDWIEWKSDLDLTERSGCWHIAKQVLGFSNRTVAAAARNAEGYGYMLVGVSPGAITGVDTIDNADLTRSVGQYAGAVRWSPEYVTVDGNKILVVIVEPPEPGEDAYTLRKGYGNHQEGAIFVRAPGRTEQADSAQVAALFQRAKAARERLDVGIRLASSTIEFGLLIDGEDLDERVEAERTRLLGTVMGDRLPTRDEMTSALRGAIPAAMRSLLDSRTPEQYVDDVEAYLGKLRKALADGVSYKRFHHEGGALKLIVDNPTDRNFKNLQVIAEMPGLVKGWPDKQARALTTEPALPEPPRPLGTATDPYSLARMAFPRNLVLGPAMPLASAGPRFKIANTGSATITFDAFHLRPRKSEVLPAVPLHIGEPVGADLPITWTATADNVDGVCTGELTITVIEGAIGLPAPPP